MCNVAKRRRHKHKAVKPEDTHHATKMYEKTMFDTVESGRDNLRKGVNGFAYGTAVKDEASDFAHFGANRKKDHIATGEAIREYFGNDMKLAKGFYTDGARAFVKNLRTSCGYLLGYLFLILLLLILAWKPGCGF